MNAIVCTQYGSPDVLQLKEVPRPVPKDKQVLVKVHTASVNRYDWIRFAMPLIVVRLMDSRMVNSLHTILGVDLRGELKQLAPASRSFGQGMKPSESPRVTRAPLPSTRARPQEVWR